MSLVAATTGLAERLPLPDALIRVGVGRLADRTHRRMSAAPADADAAFATAMRARRIARRRSVRGTAANGSGPITFRREG